MGNPGKKGQIVLYITLLGILIFGLALGWIYIKDRKVFGELGLPNIFQQMSSFNTQDWEQFTADDGKLIFYYPPGWYKTENTYISQYPYTPGKASNDIYNAISVRLITDQLQASYANENWFGLLYGSRDGVRVINEFHPADQIRLIKVESGKTLKGAKFVVFKDQGIPSALQAFLLIGNTKIYQFTLDRYDDKGYELFKQIISTSVSN